MPSADLVRAQMTWIDRYVYRPMIGVYYGTDPSDIAQSSERLGSALEVVAERLVENGGRWLVGDEPTLAEALMVAVYVRLDGLRQLGLTATIPPAVTEHIERCRTLEGWAAVEWSPDQIEEFVGRFETYRSRRRDEHRALLK